MKYRHSYHAGNFADVHKHVAVLALLAALARKDKGFLYFETHAGSGDYTTSDEADAGITKLAGARFQSEELRVYKAAVDAFRKGRSPRAYPGSPILAAGALRPQDRGIAVEILPPEARALERALGPGSPMRVHTGDGFERLRAALPPAERRGLVLIDPPFEETRQDFERVGAMIADSLRRFESGVYCAWYPIKEERDIASWKAGLVRALNREVLFSELWIYPRDSRVGLNGSGLAIVNAPYQIDERMKVWMPELSGALDAGKAGGSSVETVRPAT
ncbi:MAG: 23S rRNA (adenine(2030)-N(6))-methyltransferase RlmJ [Gammaproteobacteria bacterium]